MAYVYNQCCVYRDIICDVGDKMVESVKEMYNWIKLYYPDMVYVCIMIAAAIYLFVCKKENRRSVISPIIVILICILNPVIYQKLLSRMVYWRMFWMIPDAIIIAYAATDIIKRCNKVTVKMVLLASFISVIVITGVCMYNRENFELIQNPQKVTADTEEVCDAILSIDKHPRCVLPYDMYSEARQYNGDIELMYGRNAEGYINKLDEKYWYVFYELFLDEPNYEYVFSTAAADGYNFIVNTKDKPVEEEVLIKYGYLSSMPAGEYVVYYR